MEEMNKEIMENGAVEIVEEVVEKVTFKENVLAYGLAGIFGLGVVTTGYLAFKGGKKLYQMSKKKVKSEIEETETDEIVDIEDEDIQDDINESEDK